MTALTGQGIAATAQALRTRQFSATELAQAHLAAIAAHDPALNAFITVTPEIALRHAAEADAALASGNARPLAGIPIANKDLFCTEGTRTTAGSRILAPLHPTLRQHRHRQPPPRRRRLPGQDQPRRVRHGLLQHDQRPRPRRQPLGPRFRQAPRPRRLLRWLRRRRRRRPRHGRHRHRHRRLHPPARRLLRHRRHEAHLRPMLPLRHRRLRQLPRPGRPHGPLRRGLRHPPHLHGRLRPPRQHQRRPPRPRLRRRLRPRREGPAHRHPPRIPERRHRPRDRRPVGPGPGLAPRPGRRDRRRLPPPHQVRPRHLLHRRPGRSLQQPRPLRRRPLRRPRRRPRPR